MPTGKYIPLCGPNNPVTGLYTTPIGPYVPTGGLEVATNIRVVRGYAQSRFGTAAIDPTYVGLAGTYTRGGEAEVIQDGTTKIFQALRQAGKSDIYVSDDDGISFSNITNTKKITSTTNATPISVTATAHGLTTGDQVEISNVAGVSGVNTPNATWTITKTGANTFTLNGSASGAGAGTGGHFTLLSGPYGDVRLTQLADLQATWALVRDPLPEFSYLSTARDSLIIQGGNGKPELYAKMPANGGFTAGTYGTAKITAVDAPTGVKTTGYMANAVGNYLDFGGASYTNTGANFVGSGTTYGLFNASAGAVTGNSVTLDFGADYDFSAAKMLVMYVRDKYLGWTTTNGLFNSLQFELGDSAGNWWTMISPNAAAASAAYVSAAQGNGIAYQIGVIPDTSITFDYTKCRKIRATYAGVSPVVTAANCAILAFAMSGTLYNLGDFSVAYQGRDFRTIGPATVSDTLTTAPISTSGGIAGINWIYSSLFPWNWIVDADLPSGAQTAAGVNYALLFARVASIGDYYYTSIDDQIASFAAPGPWAAGSAPQFIVNDATFTLNTTIIAPPGDSLPVPGSSGSGYTPMVAANGRLFVGNNSLFYYSVYSNPFQFRYVPNLADANSAGSFTTQGETIYALRSISGIPSNAEALGSPQIGSASVLMWTGTNMSLISGWDSTSLNKRQIRCDFGTVSPNSIAISRHGVYWFTNERQVYFWNGNTARPMTWNIIDSIFDGIPTSRIPYVSACVANAAYYLSYTPHGGTTNVSMAVYDETSTLWTTDTPPNSLAYDGLLAYRKSGNTVIYAFQPTWASTSGLHDIYKHDLHGTYTDLGDNIAISMTFKEVDGRMEDGIAIRGIRVTCDPADGGLLTFVRTSRDGLDTQTGTGTMSLTPNAGCTRVVRQDTATDFAEVQGDAISVNMTGSVPGTWRLVDVMADIAYVTKDRADSLAP